MVFLGVLWGDGVGSSPKMDDLNVGVTWNAKKSFGLNMKTLNRSVISKNALPAGAFSLRRFTSLSIDNIGLDYQIDCIYLAMNAV